MSTHIFSGSAHALLAHSIASNLKVKLAKSTVERFPNSECKVTITTPVINDTCIVVQPTNNPTDENLMELVLFCDALKRCEAKSVIGVIPYLGYTRQDRQHRAGECVSLNVVAHFLESSGFSKIYTVNIHSEPSAGIFSIPFKNLDATAFLARETFNYLKAKKVVKSPENCVVVAPDHGALIQARVFAETLNITNPPRVVVVDKQRDKHNGSLLLHTLYGDVTDKVVIIVDDVLVSGSTLIESAKLCMKMGARAVYASVVHHDLVENTIAKVEKSPIKQLFTTDTIKLSAKSDRLIEFSLAKYIARELKQYLHV